MKVSVIIPTYNHLKALRKCLEALRKQTLKEVEIIVVDDASTDGTGDYLATQNGIQVITMADPQGARLHRRVSVARNAGAARATGEYLFFCDADVRLRRTALAELADALDHNPSVGFVYCSFIWGWKWFRAVPFDVARLRQHNYISTMSLVRASLFTGFDEELDRFQDWDLWLGLTAQEVRGMALSKTLFWVSRHANEISHRTDTYQSTLAAIQQKHHLN